ncbi:hypothetical protein RLEG12_14965 [Rhizobium leguminosarum bv. trifolii CB782]|uniref:Uncharacterized protein n=1 Tax=Rhizobium hidalgonense TaxID=1538159 RepID=A0A2A6K3D7_9HYPH|nr:hypothetical protein [Rhizobium hidalgonense]AHG44444.1 hypothetical protein RLEG12_14965 [Rhizobium leguminosarum bv. trifolii CB782]EJC73823.1 hypothetical protein Rleg10DRAFT_2288 [Rhizobium leguminosarum bv. trifolii WSM2012]MDR9777099.1 hypothetical protein [Rhizobium hidalgonense]MDR9813160.1 hypothetical protein [Rhizobium hidalgonense]MDR9823437.1 hypothetical protein [Rhizobium hidalgonense]
MKVLLTRKALNEVRRFGEYMSRSERDRELVPSIEWASPSTSETTGQITELGSHLYLGALEADKLQGRMILKQEGVTFALALPKEAERLAYVKIDYAGRDFFISS